MTHEGSGCRETLGFRIGRGGKPLPLPLGIIAGMVISLGIIQLLRTKLGLTIGPAGDEVKEERQRQYIGQWQHLSA